MFRRVVRLWRFRAFHDLPLRVKVVIAPAVCLAAGLAVAVAIWSGATETEHRLALVVHQALPTTAASTQLLDITDRIQTAAMRAVVWQQANVERAMIDRLAQTVLADLKAQRELVVQMRDRAGANDGDRARLKAIEADLATYTRMLNDALDLIDDPAIAVGYFRRTDATFESLRRNISALAAAHREAEAAAVQSARARSRATLLHAWWIFGGAGALVAVLLPLVVAAITRPVRALTRTMNELAAGKLDAVAAGQDHRDELGDMARAVHVFRQNALEARRLAADRDAAQAAKERRQVTLASNTATFGASVSGVLTSLGGSADSMRQAADAMAAAAQGVRQQAGNTAEGAGAASRDLASVGAAVQQLASNVEEITRQVAAAAVAARDAVRQAEASQHKIRAMAEAATRIGDVVRLISDIAGQTSLLALNATIEAARAGDAGKGFAVVAGEVKALAAQTAKATADVGEQIARVRAVTEESVSAMAAVGETIGRMDAVTSAIAGAVEEQSQTTRQIAGSVQSISGASGQTVQAMEQVRTMADEAGSLSGSVLRAATVVGENAATLRAEVDRFLSATRTDGAPEATPAGATAVAARVAV